VPGIRTALLSRMGPKTSLTSHQGWATLSNHVLRVHLGVDIPDDGPRVSGVAVEDDVRWHANGELLVFDDSKVHAAFNHHGSKPRVVLIFDIARPAEAPPGVATGGTTAELEDFMRHFH
jgi:aspartyl/asparaginyl beta-hydroxylase (cupin superfamily)